MSRTRPAGSLSFSGQTPGRHCGGPLPAGGGSFEGLNRPDEGPHTFQLRVVGVPQSWGPREIRGALQLMAASAALNGAAKIERPVKSFGSAGIQRWTMTLRADVVSLLQQGKVYVRDFDGGDVVMEFQSVGPRFSWTAGEGSEWGTLMVWDPGNDA